MYAGMVDPPARAPGELARKLAASTLLRGVQAGYAAVNQDVRGCWSSGGEFTPYIDETRDGADTLHSTGGSSAPAASISTLHRSSASSRAGSAAEGRFKTVVGRADGGPGMSTGRLN
jgi:hypothetical protein